MKPWEPQRRHRDPERAARLRALFKAGAAVAVIGVLTLLNALVPFFSLLPASRIRAREEGELRLHFLDVGQADCTVIEFPSGDVLVVDAGSGAFDASNHLIRYLKGLGPESISCLVTHADSDHYGGAEQIIRLFGAEVLYLPVLGSESSSYQSLLSAAEESGCEMQTVSRYFVLADASGAYLNCISPYSMGEEENNEASAVLYLSYCGTDVLLCGDITAEREEKLLAEYAIDPTLFDKGDYRVRLDGIDVLKVAHHGSAYSSSEEWLELLQAQTAVISCGRGNAYGHPAFRVAESLKKAREDCEIYRTDELGDIVVSVTRAGYRTEYTKGVTS